MPNDIPTRWSELYTRLLDFADQLEASDRRQLAATVRELASRIEERLFEFGQPLQLDL
jgi:hypothetical protein